MRTQEQIAAKLRQVKDDDFFGVLRADLLERLDWQHAKEFLAEGTTEEDWTPEPNTEEALKKTILEYLPFAWDKANNQRGLSASRSMDHFTAWTWLLGDEDAFGDLQNYTDYGKDHLVNLCQHYGLDPDQFDVRNKPTSAKHE